jgi:opacity protein-like surface antigen
VRARTRASFTAASCLALAGLGTASPLTAQGFYATPEAGLSEHRGMTIGGRVGHPVVAGLDLVAQGLIFFPDENGVADPGVAVTRSAWHTSLNALYFFDRTRGFAPYVGVGLRYGRASLSVIVDGLRAAEVDSGVSRNILGGAQINRLPGRPFIEYRTGGPGGWILSAGGHFALSPG